MFVLSAWKLKIRNLNTNLVKKSWISFFIWLIFCFFMFLLLFNFTLQYKSFFDFLQRLPQNKIILDDKDLNLKEYWLVIFSISFLKLLELFNFLKKPSEGNSFLVGDLKVIVNTAYSYVFLATLFSFITLIFHFFVCFQLEKQSFWEKRNKIEGIFNHNYLFFKNFIYLELVSNITIIFCFFNSLTVVVVFLYALFLFLIEFFLRFIFTRKFILREGFLQQKNIKFFLSLFFFQVGYLFLKDYFFERFGVNIDLAFKIIFPIGSLTLFISLFLKKMWDSSINVIHKEISEISKKVDDFQTFFVLRRERVFEDYQFVMTLPKFVKEKIKFSKTPQQQQEVFETIRLLDLDLSFFKKKIEKKNHLDTIFYLIFNKIGTYEEIEIIKDSVVKVGFKPSPLIKIRKKNQ